MAKKRGGILSDLYGVLPVTPGFHLKGNRGNSEKHRLAALARWADPAQHIKASLPRGKGKGGTKGWPGDPEGHARASKKGYSHPRKPHGPGGNTKRRTIGTRASRGLPPRVYPKRKKK